MSEKKNIPNMNEEQAKAVVGGGWSDDDPGSRLILICDFCQQPYAAENDLSAARICPACYAKMQEHRDDPPPFPFG